MSTTNSEELFARGGTKLTVELFEKLQTASGNENIVVSPFSIRTCMALAYSGARGETAKEIATAMGFYSNAITEVADKFHQILATYKDSDLLKIANKVYMPEGNTLLPTYSAIVKDMYHSEAETLNFSENDTAAKTMNSWVEHKTEGKIQNLISPDSLDEKTRFVLLNALHFKGQWREKFDPADTQKGDFWINKDEAVKVDFMFQEEKLQFGYFDEYKCTALEMPYKNSDLSMFVIMPQERDGLKELAARLKDADLFELAGKMNCIEVFVRFPKFKIDYAVELSEVLQKIGITTAFHENADFGNMVEPAQRNCISKIFHKASIEVNEEGTEASAATALVPRPCCMPPTFVADHPFFYWIWNRKNILFAGAFVKAPKAEA